MISQEEVYFHGTVHPKAVRYSQINNTAFGKFNNNNNRRRWMLKAELVLDGWGDCCGVRLSGRTKDGRKTCCLNGNLKNRRGLMFVIIKIQK